VAK
jgi:hypothetical protein